MDGDEIIRAEGQGTPGQFTSYVDCRIVAGKVIRFLPPIHSTLS